MDAALALVVFAPALALGSFLNVVAARLPDGRSLVRPRSACWLLRGGDRVVRQHPARLVLRPARPLQVVRSLVQRPLSGRRARHGAARGRVLLALRAHRRGRGRRVLLRRARRPLGDRRRAAHPARTHRPAVLRDRPDGEHDPRAGPVRRSGWPHASAPRSSSSWRSSPTRRGWAWATSSSRCSSAPAWAGRWASGS